MNRLTALLLDDEEDALRKMEMLLKSLPSIEMMGSYTDPHEAIRTVVTHEPDILFIDIDMPALSGFEVLKQLNTAAVKPYIVFVTAFDQYAIKAIKAGAFDYLLKPVDPVELAETIAKIRKSNQSHTIEQRLEMLENELNSHRKIRFNTRSAYILLKPDEIFYVEADANYSEIYLVNNKREVVSMNLGAIQEILPKQFLRISRSVIINSDYLVKVSGVNKRCKLKKDGEEIEFTVPEKQMAELKRAIGEL